MTVSGDLWYTTRSPADFTWVLTTQLPWAATWRHSRSLDDVEALQSKGCNLMLKSLEYYKVMVFHFHLAFYLKWSHHPVAYCTPAHINVWVKNVIKSMYKSVKVYLILKTGLKSCLCNEMHPGCWAVVGVGHQCPLWVDEEDPAHLHQFAHWNLYVMKNATRCDCCTDIWQFLHVQTLEPPKLAFQEAKSVMFFGFNDGPKCSDSGQTGKSNKKPALILKAEVKKQSWQETKNQSPDLRKNKV